MYLEDMQNFMKNMMIKKVLARACARTGTHMIKFEKYELSAFIGKNSYIWTTTKDFRKK